MNTIFVLIVMIHSSFIMKSNSDELGFQEFTSKQTCETAAALVIKNKVGDDVVAFCTPK